MAFDLVIVTPSREAFRGSVEGVVLPGSEGDFGVLAQHERFLSPLRVGQVEIRREDDVLYAAISQGFADVSGEEVVVLVESCELAHEIDVAEAELARDRAEQGLGELGVSADEVRRREYEAALERARNLIEVSQHSQG